MFASLKSSNWKKSQPYVLSTKSTFKFNRNDTQITKLQYFVQNFLSITCLQANIVQLL